MNYGQTKKNNTVAVLPIKKMYMTDFLSDFSWSGAFLSTSIRSLEPPSPSARQIISSTNTFINLDEQSDNQS